MDDPNRFPAHSVGAIRPSRGTAAIEFALMLPLLFGILYGAISYGLIFFINQSMVFAAEEGARSAIRVEDVGQLQSHVTSVVHDRLDWLPAAYRDEFASTVTGPASTGDVVVTVTLPRNALPLAPLSLPGIGTIPRVPETLRAHATIVTRP